MTGWLQPNTEGAAKNQQGRRAVSNHPSSGLETPFPFSFVADLPLMLAHMPQGRKPPLEGTPSCTYHHMFTLMVCR
eukprot:scaffold98003_cov18-Tisochrysis_lutea.AAC.2